MLISKTHKCQFCHDVLDTYAQFSSHLTKHSDEKRFKCPDAKCDQLFSKIDAYLEHTKTQHQIKPKFACSKCDKVFVSESRLSLHEYAHTLKKDEKKTKNISKSSSEMSSTETLEKPIPLQCLKCKITFATLKGYNQHMIFVNHEEVRCPICDQKFVSDIVFKKHLKTHLNRPEEVLATVCPFCDKKFKSEFYLKSHILIHTGELPFGCDQCNAKFNRKDKLKRHSLMHGAKKKFHCPFRENLSCKKEFYRLDKLKSHVRTHGNSKRTKCLKCNETFPTSTLLQKHLENPQNHPEYSSANRVKCYECSETFKLEKQRRIHHETFHGIRHHRNGTSSKKVDDLSHEGGCEMNAVSSFPSLDRKGSQPKNITVYIESSL